ncbi:MAG: helix-turn-helix domain-containing protein [Candidatus Bathyarchaeota archaeon]|nr:helix-turn-helix domain-containing protein [Candidatus Bathyarchaeota archaeon]
MTLKPPCEYIVQYILPTFRLLVAKRLIKKHNFTQAAAAKKLGITQASISHYLYSKRGIRKINQIKRVPKIKNYVDRYVENLVNDKSPSINDMPLFCELCISLIEDGIISKIFKTT